jgi:stringent starvation protein B
MAEIPAALPCKREVVERLLARGMVFLHLDPRREGVEVPGWLKDQIQIVLQIGLDMPIPIPDLHLEEQGIFATLSFNRSPFSCIVPWRAIFAVVGDDGRGMVWPEDMPPEIAAEVEREVRRRGMAGPSTVDGRRRADGKRADGKRVDGKRVDGKCVDGKLPAPLKTGEATEATDRSKGLDPLPCENRSVSEASRNTGGPGAAAQLRRSRRAPHRLPPYLRVVK